LSRRIAITGASGFIGHHVVEIVRRKGWQPIVLLRGHPRELLSVDSELKVVLGDLSDRSSLERLVAGAEAIIHVAGAVKARDQSEFFEINTRGTERLLVAAAAINPSAPFIHVSSLAAREPNLSPYAASKRAAEDKVRSLSGARPTAILRPPAVYGPHDTALLPLFRLARLGVLPYPAAPDARFSIIHGADLAGAIAHLLEKGWQGDLQAELDDGADNGHDWGEVIATLARLAGRTPWAIRLSRGVMAPIALAAQFATRLSGGRSILSLAKLNELFHLDWVVRPPKPAALEQWRPAFNIGAGFTDAWRWYRSRGLLG
jgi:nucleoside-diphosphate-sugar epimerase